MRWLAGRERKITMYSNLSRKVGTNGTISHAKSKTSYQLHLHPTTVESVSPQARQPSGKLGYDSLQ